MKRILTRSQYLENLKNTQYDNITRVNEALENDTKWGDSLLGRLIFSTIRSAKSGYKTKKIEGILKDLQTQLDIIISASLTRDNAAIFNETYIKSTLEEIKNVCLSTESDEEKLKQLIGWDGRQYMWDPAGQKTINPDSPGRRIDGVDNIMQNIIDRITENLPNLESLFGMSRNAILDSLSDFTIELRKLTVELLGGTPGGNTTTIRSFPDIFGKAKEKINNLQPQNASYIFHRTYYEFLRESENKEENTKTIKDLKDWFSKINVTKFKGAVDFIKSNEYKEFKNICDSLSEEDKETLKNDEDINEFMEEIKKHSPSSSEETDKTEVKSPKTKSILYTTPEGKQVLDEWKEKQKKEGRTNMSPGEGTRPNLEKEVQRRIELNKKGSEDKKGPETNTTTNTPAGTTGSNSISGTTSNESYRYYSFDELIREMAGNPPGSTPSPPTPRTVESIWKDFFEKEDKKEPFRLTQREIEELKRGDKLKVDDLFLDVKKNPDPILALVRIWTRAHNLYFTKLIPSGRSSGAVTQATYFKYVHLGGGASDSPGKPDSPGFNWALKSAWDKWTDGVLKILQDQKYRKVLANIKFKVAGAEDSFNKVVGESVKFIVEELETDTRTAREDGRNLFKFMNDLLEPETAGKFETERKKLLNLYFGIDAKEGSLGKLQSSDPVNNEPRKDDIEANSLVWKPFSDLDETKKFNDFGQSEKGSYFALPLQSENKQTTSMLFFIVIGKVKIQNKDCNIIKFVFGDEEKLIGKSIKEHDNKKYEKHKYPNWKIQGTNDGNKLHYGIIHIDGSDAYRLVHVNVTDPGSIETKKYHQISNISNMVPSKMVEYDSTKNLQKFNILDIKIDDKDNATLKTNYLTNLNAEMDKLLK